MRAKSVKIFGEQIDVNAEIALLDGLSGHADRQGLLNWLSSYDKKPGYVFVNHGDDESCTAFAQTVTSQFGISSSAPFAGSCFDLLAGEWIRLAEPIRRKAKKESWHQEGKASQKTKTDAYRELRAAVEELDKYTQTLSEHSNAELNRLARLIRDLCQ